MKIYTSPYFEEHESVNFFYDPDTGLKVIIAIHNTNLGPALGGCRFIEYDNEEEAYVDALNLSKSMTYKAAISDLPLGGGKMVIIKNDTINLSREEIFKKAAKFVNNLNGRYITAVDSGTNINDIKLMADFTPHIVGHNDSMTPTSCFTAYSVLNGIKRAIEFLYDTMDFKELKVAIQGLGKTGYYLCKYLHELGAKLYVTDYDHKLVEKVVTEFGAIEVGINSIYSLEVDIFAPCALGGIINNITVNQFRCKIICGAANNQLSDPKLAQILQNKNILYVPDYVVNSGGLISVYYDQQLINNPNSVFIHIDSISLILKDIFIQAQNTCTATNLIADKITKIKLQANNRIIN